jgi:DNA segregation ATPase FtsK/SpoIIIE, S-DNA-T family
MATQIKSRKHNKRRNRDWHGAMAGRRSPRPIGSEFRALAWLVRHPGWVLVPVLALGAVATWGTTAAVSAVATLVVGLLVWWRAHPASFDRWAAPRIRSTWRRWTAYRGRRWRDVLDECDLTREHRRSGQLLVPRILRVRSVTASIDVLTVRMVRGQEPMLFIGQSAALAEALGAHQVAVSRARPGVLTIVVERRMPFDHTLDAPEIPASVAEVDLRGLDVGDNEYGQPFLLRVKGKMILVVGASGAGKGSLLWGPLRAIGPMIRAGLVRLWVVDLKGGTETERGARLFHRWATTLPEAITLLREFRDSMVERQAWMRSEGVRDCPISPDTPYNLLIIDELAMLTAYGDSKSVREAHQLLGQILTQSRATAHSVMAYVQEPTKDIVEMRDLFTLRICLGVTTASHVEMALGEGARDRGALADQIPGDPEHAGIGFVVDEVSRLPIRFRAGWVTDAEIDELVQRCAPDECDVIPLDTRNQRDRDQGAREQGGQDQRRRIAYTDDEDDWDDDEEVS